MGGLINFDTKILLIEQSTYNCNYPANWKSEGAAVISQPCESALKSFLFTYAQNVFLKLA